MSEAKFTKGKWKSSYEAEEGVFDIGMKSYLRNRGIYSPIHHIELYSGIWPEDGDQFYEARSNAYLIAAAPDMYEALLQIQEWLLEKGPLVDDGITHPLFIKANNLTQAALAKATH